MIIDTDKSEETLRMNPAKLLKNRIGMTVWLITFVNAMNETLTREGIK